MRGGSRSPRFWAGYRSTLRKPTESQPNLRRLNHRQVSFFTFRSPTSTEPERYKLDLRTFGVRCWEGFRPPLCVSELQGFALFSERTFFRENGPGEPGDRDAVPEFQGPMCGSRARSKFEALCHLGPPASS